MDEGKTTVLIAAAHAFSVYLVVDTHDDDTDLIFEPNSVSAAAASPSAAAAALPTGPVTAGFLRLRDQHYVAVKEDSVPGLYRNMEGVLHRDARAGILPDCMPDC